MVQSSVKPLPSGIGRFVFRCPDRSGRRDRRRGLADTGRPGRGWSLARPVRRRRLRPALTVGRITVAAPQPDRRPCRRSAEPLRRRAGVARPAGRGAGVSPPRLRSSCRGAGAGSHTRRSPHPGGESASAAKTESFKSRRSATCQGRRGSRPGFLGPFAASAGQSCPW